MAGNNQKKLRDTVRNLLSELGTPREKETRKTTRKRCIERFRHLTKEITAIASSSVIEPKVTKTEVDDFSAHADALYDVLSRYAKCQDSESGDNDIIPRISLNGYRKHAQSGSAFDVLFPDHPHLHTHGLAFQWQNAVVQVPQGL